ncbi:fimbria/pilus outer membrane usher protein [Cobetia sp. L2A1]|uniref:fimbria/pilus outer membrane usher protein n=1 Tax=Cobetia sp. L2A1 TaxID=2686360 RepID=UPI00131EB399|nr:fimbria/pilus outer membrane usher protein [Cobetia sp. L2A1]
MSECHAALREVGDASLRLLSVSVNGKPLPAIARILDSPEQGLLVSRVDLERWELIVPPEILALQHLGKVYYPLNHLEGLTYSIDGASQVLVLQAAPRQLVGSSIDLALSALSVPQEGVAGGFLNYDVLHQSRSDISNSTSGILEVAGFNQWGLMTTTLLARDGHAAYGDSRLVRLTSNLRHDDPAHLRTLTLGDTYSRAGAWGRSVLYGGVQWGTNFTTQPDFTTFPLPNIEGEATVPSSVEIYANDRQQAQNSVNAGPFSVSNIPVITGANDVRLIVRDVLGREQVVVSSFYASQQLLRSGLHDYTYEAGAIREDYSRASNEYGRGFLVANHDVGVSDSFTGGLRLEALAAQQTAGVSGAWLVHPGLGVVTGALAGSTAQAGEGGLASLGLEHRGRHLSFGASTTATTQDFRQLGLREETSPASWTTRANIGTRLPQGGAFGLGYADIVRRDDMDSRIVSANYSTRLSSDASLSLYASRELVSHESFVGISLSMSLGERTSVSVGHDSDGQGYRNRLQLQRNAPRGNGVGYRLSAEQSSEQRDGVSTDVSAEVAVRGDHGAYLLQAARYEGETGYRLNATGGVALLAGNMFVTRRIDDSFGIVKVGEYPDVTVYSENQRVATTNGNGVALIPDLRSFERNRLSFEQADIPLGARLDGRDATIVPGYRRGLLVDFKVKAADGALLTVIQPGGEPIPAGATIRHSGATQRFPVARRGEAWVTGLGADNQLTAQWGNHRCHFTARMPTNAGPMPRIGPLLCQESP